MPRTIQALGLALILSAMLPTQSFAGDLAVLDAVRMGNERNLKQQIEMGHDLNAADEAGVTPLMVAVEEGWVQAVRILLENGADANRTAMDGSTALMRAVTSDAVSTYAVFVIEELISHNAEINARNLSGETALMKAVSAGRHSGLRLLIENGAELNEVDQEGKALIEKALASKYSGILSILLEYGAPIPADGCGLVLDAIDLDCSDCLYVLIDHFDVNCESERGSPLQYAFVHYARLDTIETLVRQGADPNVRNSNGYTLLMEAATKGREHLIYWMLKTGVRLDDQDQEGNTALMYAVRARDIEIVKLLLAQGADATLLNRKGESALYMAEDTETCQLCAPVDPDRRALYMADYAEIARLLRKWAH